MKGTVIRRGSTYSVVLDLGRGPDGKRIRKWHSGYGPRRTPSRHGSSCWPLVARRLR